MTISEKVGLARRAGRVQRFHTRTMLCRENVAEHTFNMMNILMILTDGQASVNLLKAVLLHDQGEYVTGDIPSPIKRVFMAAGESIVEEMEVAAISSIHHHGCPVLTEWEQRMLKLADNLDGFIKASEEVRMKNMDCLEVKKVYAVYLNKQLAEFGGGAAHDHAAEIMRSYE